MRFLIGIPTRYGNFPAQWKAFWDTTGGQWGSGGYYGKYAGVFVSTGTPGGGQRALSLPLCLPWHTTEVSGVPINGPLAVLEIRFCTKLYTNIHSSHLRSPWICQDLPPTHQRI